MTKRLATALAVAFFLGAASPIALALYLGGETVAQAGLRLAAIEQGFALAQRHWQFEATPEHEAVAGERIEPAARVAAPPKKVAKR